MQSCRFCGKPLQQEDAVCIFCGYDPKTDTIDQSFKPQTRESQKQRRKLESKKKKEERAQQHKGCGIDPKVKKFALFGLALVVFSIFYKYNFNIHGVVFEINQLYDRYVLRIVKFVKTKFITKSDDKTNKEIKLISVRTFEEPRKIADDKNLTVEGILFDPAGKNFATINGRVLSEGDSFENITVKKINRDSVELMVDGETKVLEINQSIPWKKKK